MFMEEMQAALLEEINNWQQSNLTLAHEISWGDVSGALSSRSISATAEECKSTFESLINEAGRSQLFSPLIDNKLPGGEKTEREENNNNENAEEKRVYYIHDISRASNKFTDPCLLPTPKRKFSTKKA